MLKYNQLPEISSLFYIMMANIYQDLQNYEFTEQDHTDKFLGNTPLLWGIASAAVEAVNLLLDRKLGLDDINVKDQYFNQATPLILTIAKGWHHKCAEGHHNSTLPMSAVAIKLLSLNAEVNAKDKHGRTALHYALIRRDIEAINALTKHGADWNIRDNHGNLPQALCFLEVKEVNQILSEATGGSQNHTYTLGEQFYELEEFCSKAQKLYPEQLPDLLIKYKLNCSIAEAIKPLKKHAESLSKISTSIAQEKSAAIHQLCRNIERLSRDDISRGLSQRIQKEIDQGLQNPALIKERDLLRRAGLLILNTLASLFGVTLIKGWATGSFFFTHQTKTEQLIKEAQSTFVSMP